MNKSKILLWSSIIFITVFESDRVTKQYAINTCINRKEINQFLSCELLINRGVTGSLFYTESKLGFLLLSIFVACVALALAVYTFMRWKNNAIIFAESMVLAGAFSNLIDRALFGGVIDFIAVSIFGWHFPVFNVADACIVLGVAGIFLIHVREQ